MRIFGKVLNVFLEFQDELNRTAYSREPPKAG
jgi:hypothetical protein